MRGMQFSPREKTEKEVGGEIEAPTEKDEEADRGREAKRRAAR